MKKLNAVLFNFIIPAALGCIVAFVVIVGLVVFFNLLSFVVESVDAFTKQILGI